MDLKLKALEFEGKAKIAKDRDNYEEAAKFHRKAAEVYSQIGDEKNSKWNFANYHSIMGTNHSRSNEFNRARESFRKAEELFLELGLREPAFVCASNYMRTFIFKEELKQETAIQTYLEGAELFLEKYKDFSEHRYYIESQISFYKRKSIKYRLEGKYELAEIWTKKCYELAKQAYDRFKRESFKKASFLNEHIYWNLKAKRLEAEKKFEEAAECYKKSAEVISKMDKKVATDEYINHYKCMAIANKYDKDVFEEKINKAIELAKEIKDEKQKHYLLALKCDHFVKFAQNIDEKIELLKQAKENYYRAGEKNLGKAMEFVLFYYLSKKELGDGNYERSLYFFNKAMNCAKYAKFPNIVSSPDVLEYEKHLHEAYLHLSRGQFSNAFNSLDNWLNLRKELENTKRYRFYKNLKHCCSMLSKGSFSKDDLFTMEKILQFVHQNKLGIELYRICSLVYSLISLWIHNIRDKKILEKIKLEITGRITTTEAAKDLERRLEIQRAVEETDWLLRLPPVFVEKFDHCLYILENVLNEFRYTAYREFYVLLENFLRIIVEFNAKVLWPDAWRVELEAKVTINQKPFEKFTFGDFVHSLKVLKGHDAKFLKDISEDIFDLLDKHVEIRNNLSHEFISKLPELNIVEDTLKIMFGLLQAFPTCINVITTKKKPWYDVEIIWSQLPRRAILYSDEKLEKRYYYAEPMLEIVENKLHPKSIIKSPSSLDFSSIGKGG